MVRILAPAYKGKAQVPEVSIAEGDGSMILVSNGSLTGNNELGLAWLLRPIEPGQVIFGVSKRHRQTRKYFMQCGDIGERNLNPYGQFAKTFLKTWGK